MLTQVCQDARFTKTVAEGHFVLTTSAMKLEEVGITSSCREYTRLRDELPEETHREQQQDLTYSGCIGHQAL